MEEEKKADSTSNMNEASEASEAPILEAQKYEEVVLPSDNFGKFWNIFITVSIICVIVFVVLVIFFNLL